MNSFNFAFIQALEKATDAGKAAGAEVAPKAAEAAEAAGGSVYGKLLFVVAVLILPFVLGHLLASVLKLKDDGMRFSTCLFALFASVAPFVWHGVQGTDFNNIIRRGIDLAGGTNMVFQVDQDQTEKDITNQAMDQMVAAVSRRINKSGTEEVTVRQVGSDRIEVIVPGADPGLVADLKARMVRLGSLEFGLVANSADHASLIAKANDLPNSITELREGGEIVAVWRRLGEKSDGTPKTISPGDHARRTVSTEQGEQVDEILIVRAKENNRITGKYLTRANSTADQAGRPAVGFNFDRTGAWLFEKLTRANRPRADGSRRFLAILLDNKVHSAPSINSIISDQGIIEGDFSLSEVRELTSVLNAGALELPLKPDPINEMTIDPLLGADVQEKGMRAIAIASIAVVIFMLLYYRFAGFVAVICLAMNLLLVLGCMVAIQATFTLPGIAGLVLTIGMAVDANVLIFERIREETARGSSLRMAIQNGFGRAFTTIVDANVTTLITAAILFMIGTDQVKGFAVTLIIGILMSMFTALYFGRLLFDLFERKRWITKLSMSSIVGTTNLDFIGKRGLAAVASAALIAVGMGAFITRGTDNYDIDFTGGTMVTMRFEEPHSIDEVRTALTANGPNGNPWFTEDITIEGLSVAGAEGEDAGSYFRLRTRDRDETASKGIKDVLAKMAQDAGGNIDDLAGNPELVAKIDVAKYATETLDAQRLTDVLSSVKKGRIEDRVNDAVTAAGGMNLIHITMDHDTPAQIPSAADGEENADPTAGGLKTDMAFSSEISSVTIMDNFMAALERVAPGEYSEVASLLQVEGSEGSGIDAAENSVKKFSKATLTTYPQLDEQDVSSALASMKEAMATKPHFDEVNSFASSVAGEMKTSALIAIIVSLIAIIGYIWFRFQQITFGLAAVAALVHDVLVVLGVVALASYLSGNSFGELLLLNDFKINLPMIAAFLTIVGYSLNDTIVVFDRIREVRGKNPALTTEMVNRSLNQTLSRTLLTSVTTFIVVAILYAIGGEGIHGFAFCLVIGVIVGTYSSIFVASPVLVWLMNRTQSPASSTSSSREKVATT
ncbi:MAG: protein translocase subunit SecD [Planctomycetaceae bacterium]